MKKKIILILPNAGGGGSEKVLIYLGNLLSNYFTVTLCFINLFKKNYLHLISKKINIININKKSSIRSFFPILKIINNNNFFLIISSIFHLNILSIFFKIFSYKKFKLIIRESNKIFNTKKNYLKFMLIFLFYRFANLIISPSNIINNELKKFYLNKKKIKFLNNPVIIYREKNNNKKFIKKFVGKDKYCITLTRLEEHKNIEFMLNCIAEINKVKKLKFIIVGQGSQKNIINDRIKNLHLEKCVKIINLLNNPYYLLKKSNLYINASYYEGQSNSVLEALYLGVPVISANNGSHVKFIKKYSRGVVFKNFNVRQVSKKILQILREKKIMPDKDFYNETSGNNVIKQLIKLIHKMN